MVYGLTYWIKSLFVLVVLFGLLGGMSAYGYFFFENREMCPCAPAGIEGAENLTVAQPYSDELMVRRSLSFGGVGALFGLAVGMFFLAPRASRLKAWTEDEPDADSGEETGAA